MTIDRGYPYGSSAGGTRIPHHGVEFYNGTGTSVLAAAEGRVYFIGDDKAILFSTDLDYYGNLIILEHQLEGKIIYTLYAHLSEMFVAQGHTVLRGQKIGEVGATGAAIGSHLHFEVRLHPEDVTSTLNPELWLQPPSGAGVLSIRYTNTSGDFLRVQSNIQYYLDRETMPVQAWQPETYAPEVSVGNNWENMLLGELPGGLYRISFLWEGVLHERWVDVQPGKLTITSFELP